MKIAYITSRYPALSHTFVHREVAELRRRGWDIRTYSVRRVDQGDLFSQADQIEYNNTFALLPISVAALIGLHLRALATAPVAYCSTLKFALSRGNRAGKRTLWQVFYFAEALILWNSCRKKNITHVHAHMANVAADVARLAVHFGGLHSGRVWSWSFTMHGPTEFFNIEQYGLADKASDADFVICISDFCRSQLMALVEEKQWSKMRVVHCGVDVTQFAPHTKEPHTGRINVLCVGRLVSVKGQSLLIEAVRCLLDEGMDLSLTLVGKGPTEEALSAKVISLGLSESVQLAGPIGQDAIRDYYELADIFCLPSSAEGVPVVLMEAMASGIPVLTTRIAGIPELVEDGVSGMLVAPGSLPELTDALRTMVKDRPLRARLANEGRLRVQAQFDISACGSVLDETFKELIQE